MKPFLNTIHGNNFPSRVRDLGVFFSLCAFSHLSIINFLCVLTEKGFFTREKKKCHLWLINPFNFFLPLPDFFFLWVVLEDSWIWKVYRVKKRFYVIQRTPHVLISYASTINEFWVIHRGPSAVADEWFDVILCGQIKNLPKFVIQ